MKKILGLLSLLLMIVNVGCTININTPSFSRRQNNQSNTVEVKLDQDGIVDGQFENSESPQILSPGQQILLTTEQSEFEFDVTFVLLVPLPEVRGKVPQGTTEEKLGDAFKEVLESKPDVTEAKCTILPRCEVTFTVPKARNSDTPGTLQVPTEILELDASSATPFHVLRIRRNNPGDEDDKFEKVENRTGFVTTENKPASARLRVPLDNTGISDWGFLNPRLPKVLSIGALELPQAPGSGNPRLRENTQNVINRLKQLAPDPTPPNPPDLSIQIRNLAVAAIEEIDRVGQLHISDRDAIEARDFENESIAVVRDMAELIIQRRQGDSTEKPKPTSCPPLKERAPSLDLQEEADRVRETAIAHICSIATTSIQHIEPPKQGVPSRTRSNEEIAAGLRIAEPAIRRLGAAAQITPEMDVPLTKERKERDVQRIKEATNLVQEIYAENSQGQEALAGIDRATTDLRVKLALMNLAVGQATGSLNALQAKVADAIEALRTEIQDFILTQQRVRFINDTVDRHFVVTLEVDRKKLLDAFPDPPACQGKDKDTCELGKIEEERYSNSIDLSFSSATSVTVTLTVPPGSLGDIDAWLLSKAPKGIVPFNVDFFDQTDDPAYSKGYIALREIDPTDSSVQPDSRFVNNLITGLTTLYEPCLGGAECSGSLGPNFPTVPPAKPDQNALYEGESRRHSRGRGQLDLSQNLGNRADAKLSLLYEANDLGQTEADNTNDPVRVSQFQVNVFGTTGLTLSLGKFTFAEPSNRIAISEAGEGLRLTWRHFSLSYIAKRESNLGVANDHNKDRETLLGEVSGPIRGTRLFRRFRITGLWGEDRCKPRRLSTSESVINGECKDASSFPYTYATLGGEVFFNARADRTPEDLLAGRSPLTGSFAAYVSRRDARLAGKPDGEGYVGLLTLGRPFDWVPEKEGSKKLKPRRILTALAGYGSGDETDSQDVDEGYIGEGAAFANDMVFLSGLAGAIRKGSLNRPLEDLTQEERRRIGIGLSNKAYLGFQYTINDSSWLEWIAVNVFNGDKRDIVSQSSTFSAHGYRFVEPVFGDREAGYEFDAEFRIEQPQFVKWRVTAGYFIPGDAVKSLVKQETWTMSVGVVIEPAKLF
ncbi:MAG TPA: hypothetical protein VGG03_01385 [Thermoanaerobaculia bacterium]